MSADTDIFPSAATAHAPRRADHRTTKASTPASPIAARALRLGRILGIELRIHPSWFLVVALVTWSFWNGFDREARFEGVPAFVMALAAALLFFGSVLAHELAHAMEARSRRISVSGITLFLFGGATETTHEARQPNDDFAVAAVGPFTSLVVAAVLGLGATAADTVGLDHLAAVLGLIGWLNFALAVFNLLPGAPLDGGRILRGLVWRITGDKGRASRAAARAGRAVGCILIGIGLMEIFFVPGAFVSGLWLSLVGWFLLGAANAELLHSQLELWLADLPVRSLPGPHVSPVPADASIEDAVNLWFRRLPDDAFLVADVESPVGVAVLGDVAAVPRPERSRHSIRDVMRPMDDLPHIDATEPASSVLEALVAHDAAIVTDNGKPVSVLTAQAVRSRMSREEALTAGRTVRR